MADSSSYDFDATPLRMDVAADRSGSTTRSACAPGPDEPRRPRLGEIISEHTQFIRFTLFHLGVRSGDLDDVMIEVLLGVHHGLPTFELPLSIDPSKAVRAWLFGICKRQAATQRRRALRRPESFHDGDDLDDLESATPPPEEALWQKRELSLLVDLLAQTTPERRAVLVAYDLEGNAMRNVALSLNIPLNTAWNRRRLGLDDLRAAWRRKKAAEIDRYSVG